MAIQYSLSYDKNGNPSLVKNTITGSRPVVNTTFNIGKLEQSREIQTNFNFVSEILSKENSNQVYKNLTTYIYEEEKGGGGQDFNPFKETEKDRKIIFFFLFFVFCLFFLFFVCFFCF